MLFCQVSQVVINSMAITAGEKLYLNEEKKDVVFFVGPDEQHRVRYPAHRLILSSFSTVFTAMLSEKFKEGETGQVVIPDVTPAAFTNVLQFAYTGTIQDPSVATCKEILYAATKYLLEDLSKFCFAHLENIAVNFDNFWDFFSIMCTFYSEFMSPKMVTNILHFLDGNAKKILSNNGFKNLNSEAVSRIVTRNSLTDVREIDILHHVFQWAKIECCHQNLEVTVENQRKVVEKIKYDIRYLLIPRNEMLDDVMTQTILTENEKKILLDGSLRANGSLPLPWNNILLSVPRGISSTVKFHLDSGEITASPNRTFAIDLLLIVKNDCVFESLEIDCIPEDSAIKITGDITDLNGNIYGNWVVQKTKINARVEAVTTGKPICLRRLKAYKLSLVCVTGFFEKKYDNARICYDTAGRECLILSNLPTDAATLHNLKSCHDDWDDFESYDFESYENNFVKSVTVKI